MAQAPRAFLSHSSLDADLALRIGRDLKKGGVDVWVDKWALAPGDSLRRKIEEGIAEAESFFVLLTPNSLQSRWVQEEIDAAFVRRVEGECRFIPILHGIEVSQLSPFLRAILCVPLDPYEEGIRSLINGCHNRRDGPPIGPPPEWANGSVESGLSRVALGIAIELCRASEHGMKLDPMVDPIKFKDAMGLADDELEEALDELEDMGFIHIERMMGGFRGIHHIGPESALYFDFDQHVHGWSTEQDSRVLATMLVNNQPTPNAPKAAQELGWNPRRMNPACAWLVEHGLITGTHEMGTYPWECLCFLPTAKTRRFARSGQL